MKNLLIEARTTNLDRVLGFIEEQLEEAGCPIKARLQIAVAAEEIFINIASYAYEKATGEASVSIRICPDPRAVELTFKDSGVPYDPLAKPDPDVTLPAEKRGIGGLGIYMVKKSMDDVRYEYKDGQNILTLVKHF